jgi:hypothetical protein
MSITDHEVGMILAQNLAPQHTDWRWYQNVSQEEGKARQSATARRGVAAHGPLPSPRGWEEEGEQGSVPRSSRRVAALLILALLVLQLLDVATTLAVIKAGGSEGNPLMRDIVHHPFLFIGLKVSFVAVVGCLALLTEHIPTRWIATVVCVYSAIVGWNLYNLIGASS